MQYSQQDLYRAIEFCNRNSIDPIVDVWIAELIAQVRAETFGAAYEEAAAHIPLECNEPQDWECLECKAKWHGYWSEHIRKLAPASTLKALAERDAKIRQLAAEALADPINRCAKLRKILDLLDGDAIRALAPASARKALDLAVLRGRLSEQIAMPFHAWPNVNEDPEHRYPAEWVTAILKYRNKRIAELESQIAEKERE